MKQFDWMSIGVGMFVRKMAIVRFNSDRVASPAAFTANTAMTTNGYRANVGFDASRQGAFLASSLGTDNVDTRQPRDHVVHFLPTVIAVHREPPAIRPLLERKTVVRIRFIALTLAVIVLATGLARAGDTPDQERDKTRKMATETLQQLYKLQPAAKGAIQKSAGYAVFNNTGVNLLLSTARGAGIAVDSKSKQETFMKMGSVGAGLGVGVKNYRVIFVFETADALSKYLDSGWSGSAQTDAAAKAGDKGGAFSGAEELAPGVWVYQITKNGLALQITLQGTKYYKDDDLNKK
jgi:lipid-binding SYLF domain-containing protein